MSPRWWSVALLFGWTLGSTVARAAAPASVPVQGVLLDEEGRALDGATTLTVLLYEAAEGGEPLHREVYQLEVDNGFFTVQLGSTTPLDLGLFVERTDVWLALQVADDAEMTPRLPIGTTPYAAWADEAGRVSWDDVVGMPESLRDGVSWTDIEGAPAGLEDGLDWADVRGVPADLLDGDADTVYSFRTGFSTFGAVIDVDATWVEDIATGVCFDTLEELQGELDAVYLSAGYVPTWSSLTGVPSELLDGDADTLYSAGTGIVLSGTTFTLDEVLVEDRARGVCFDEEEELTDLLDDDYIYTAGAGLLVSGNEFRADRTTLETWISAAAYDTEAELTALLDDNYRPSSYVPAWSEITSVPAGFADGVDNDTTYAASAPLTLSGTTFSLTPCGTGQTWVWSGSAWTCRAIVPAGAILFFSGACPTGWTEVTAMRGRTLVGTPASGTAGGTVGTALTNLGTREITSVPAHSHTVDPPATGSSSNGSHNHGILSRQDDWNVSGGTGPSFGADNGAYTVHSGFGTSPQTTVDGAHTHTVDVGAFSSSVTGVSSVDVTMPYLQLTACSAP